MNFLFFFFSVFFCCCLFPLLVPTFFSYRILTLACAHARKMYKHTWMDWNEGGKKRVSGREFRLSHYIDKDRMQEDQNQPVGLDLVGFKNDCIVQLEREIHKIQSIPSISFDILWAGFWRVVKYATARRERAKKKRTISKRTCIVLSWK